MRILLIILLLSGCAKAQTGFLGFRVDATPVYTGNLYFIGNSITIGYPLADESDRYSTLLTAILGGTEFNYGISSSTLEKRSPVDPICCGTNLLDRLSNIPVKTAGNHLLVFMFGMNDWGYNGTNYNPTNYITDYTTAINNAIAKGWPTSRILVLSPTYILDEAFSFYDGINGSNLAPDRDRMLDFVDATGVIATNTGVKFMDLYHAMEAATPSLLIGADGVHPNEDGHIFIANAINAYLNL